MKMVSRLGEWIPASDFLFRACLNVWIWIRAICFCNECPTNKQTRSASEKNHPKVCSVCHLAKILLLWKFDIAEDCLIRTKGTLGQTRLIKPNLPNLTFPFPVYFYLKYPSPMLHLHLLALNVLNAPFIKIIFNCCLIWLLGLEKIIENATWVKLCWWLLAQIAECY